MERFKQVLVAAFMVNPPASCQVVRDVSPSNIVNNLSKDYPQSYFLSMKPEDIIDIDFADRSLS